MRRQYLYRRTVRSYAYRKSDKLCNRFRLIHHHPKLRHFAEPASLVALPIRNLIYATKLPLPTLSGADHAEEGGEPGVAET